MFDTDVEPDEKTIEREFWHTVTTAPNFTVQYANDVEGSAVIARIRHMRERLRSAAWMKSFDFSIIFYILLASCVIEKFACLARAFGFSLCSVCLPASRLYAHLAPYRKHPCKNMNAGFLSKPCVVWYTV